MMSWRKFLPFGAVDETVHHFHRITLALTLVGTMSFQAVATAYLEDVKDVWYSFILTFPLTTGLIIIFLIIYHLNWKKFSFSTMLICLTLFVIVFLSLNGFSNLLHLPQYAERIKLKQDTAEQIQRSADSLMNPKPYVAEAVQRRKTADSLWQLRMDAEREARKHVQENLNREAAEAGKSAADAQQPSEAPWYLRLLMPVTVPAKILYDQFVEFYTFYGASRFWSGVVLAFILTLYIEFLRKKAKETIEKFGNSK